MNNNGKARKKAYEEKQVKQAQKVIKWIIGVLAVLAIAVASYSMWLVS